MKLADMGEKLVILSSFLFALSIPISIALDNFSAGIGILGLLFLAVGKFLEPYPPIKPLFFLLTPQVLESLFFYPKKLFKTDFNHHLAPYFTVYRTLKVKEDYLKHILLILSISTLALGISVLFEAFTWQNIKHLNFSTLSFHLVPVRAKGFLNHPLTTGGVLFILLVLFVSAYFQFGRKFYLVPVLFSTLGLIFCQSRSYWVGAAVFLFFLIFIFRSKKVLGYVLLLLIGVVLVFQIPHVKHRFETIFNPKANYSNMDRLALWKAHLKAFMDDYSLKEKFLGAGYEASSFAWREFRESFQEVTGIKNPSKNVLKVHFHGGLTHNIYLKYLTKYGILGLIGFLTFWFYVIYCNFSYSGFYEPFIKTLNSGYLGFLTAGFFENNFVDAEVQFALMFVLGINFALLHLGNERIPLRQSISD